MLRYRIDIFPPPTRIISVIAMLLSRIVPSISSLWQPLLVFVIRKWQCLQAELTTAILLYHPILWMCTVPFHTLDDDVVMIFVFCYLITTSILASIFIQIQPVFSKRLV